MHLPDFINHPLTILALGAALSLGAASCGGESDDGDRAPGGDEEAIAQTVDRAFTDDDPSLCAELLTEKFIKTFYGSTEKCRENAERGDNAESTEVLETKISGDRATALVSVSGAGAPPRPLTLLLIKDGDTWKIEGANG